MKKQIPISSTVFLAIVVLLCCWPDASHGGVIITRTLAKGTLSGITKPEQKIIKDKAQWEKLWAEHTRRIERAPKPPKIDFSKEMVVIATMGQKTTGGYEIEIVQVEEVADRLKISVRRSTPPPGSFVTQAFTSPFHMVAVRKNQLQPEFVEENKKTN